MAKSFTAFKPLFALLRELSSLFVRVTKFEKYHISRPEYWAVILYISTKNLMKQELSEAFHRQTHHIVCPPTHLLAAKLTANF